MEGTSLGYPFNGRKRQRLSGYDYRLANMYFVTFRTYGSAELLGTVTDNGVELSESGRMVDDYIGALPERFPRVQLAEWIVMPDHVHILLGLMPGDGSSLTSLSDVIHWLKTETTNAYIRGVKASGWEPFDRKVWQTSFHDRIVRDEDEFLAIRGYIRANPTRRWERICAEDQARS